MYGGSSLWPFLVGKTHAPTQKVASYGRAKWERRRGREGGGVEKLSKYFRHVTWTVSMYKYSTEYMGESLLHLLSCLSVSYT